MNEHEPQIIDMGFSVIICVFGELLGINTRVCQGRIMDTLGSDVPWPRFFGGVWVWFGSIKSPETFKIDTPKMVIFKKVRHFFQKWILFGRIRENQIARVFIPSFQDEMRCQCNSEVISP